MSSGFTKKLLCNRTILTSTRSLGRSLPVWRAAPNGLSQEITFPIAGKYPVITSLESACDQIKSGDHVFVQGGVLD